MRIFCGDFCNVMVKFSHFITELVVDWWAYICGSGKGTLMLSIVVLTVDNIIKLDFSFECCL